MKTENLSTLKINKLTQAQYDRELAAGNIDENALYLTPDDDYSNSDIDTMFEGKANLSHTHDASDIISGTLSSDILPIVPITKGGTGATDTTTALTNLGAVNKSGDTMSGTLQVPTLNIGGSAIMTYDSNKKAIKISF